MAITFVNYLEPNDESGANVDASVGKISQQKNPVVLLSVQNITTISLINKLV